MDWIIRGHHVEGQCVFGGTEEDSHSCFLVTIERRDEATLLPLIKKWIIPGTTIISDCWKCYKNLNGIGYKHSVEFGNSDGGQTN